MEIEEVTPDYIKNLNVLFSYIPLEFAFVRSNEHLCVCKIDNQDIAVFKIKISTLFRVGFIEHGPVLMGNEIQISELFSAIVDFWRLRALKIRCHLDANQENITQIHYLAKRFITFFDVKQGSVWSTLYLNTETNNSSYEEIWRNYRKGLKSDLSKAKRQGLSVEELDLSEVNLSEYDLSEDKRLLLARTKHASYHGELVVLQVIHEKAIMGIFIFHKCNRIVRYYTGVLLTLNRSLPVAHLALDYMIRKSVESDTCDSLDFWGYNIVSRDKKILGINRFKDAFRGKQKIYLPAIKITTSRLNRIMLWVD
jgi:hypothetical protein